MTDASKKTAAGRPGAAASAAEMNEFDDQPAPPLTSYGVEDWIALALFWGLAAVVFMQFFTRYVLNDSLAWTEEIARYLLIMVAFIGSGIAVRRLTHIHVEFFYVYLNKRVAFALSTLVDVIRIAFFAYATYLGWLVTQIMHFQSMVVIEWPMSIVYGSAFVGFGIMTARAVRVAIANWRAGESVLTRTATEGRHQ
jgi:TRAP-type C4-dicarboxylate transport system permease small subunit